ncbi:MAG: rhodanese-like domain-containing protein [Thermodesulfobacteriota bacterium]
MKKTIFPLSIFLALVLVIGISTYVSAVTINDVVRVTPEAVLADMEAGHKILILDIRSKGAYEAMDIRIEGDVRIPPDELEARMYELPMGTEIITYCT